MHDFSKLLFEMLENKRGPIVEAEGDAPMPAKSLRDLTQMLKALVNTVDEQIGIMDKDLQILLDKAKEQLGGVKTQFAGLRHLTTEQQKHIKSITVAATKKFKELRDLIAPLEAASKEKDVASKAKDVASQEKDAENNTALKDLQATVESLQSSLAEKDEEMQSQKMDYEYVLDFYEEQMIKMKKAEMEAKRQLNNANIDMASAFDHTKLFGNSLNETVQTKPEKKKKKKAVDPNLQHYGTFNLKEHLEKSKNERPKSNTDW